MKAARREPTSSLTRSQRPLGRGVDDGADSSIEAALSDGCACFWAISARAFFGGWATLWLQTRYPKIFGGTWSTSPDPATFISSAPSISTPRTANFYRGPDGTPNPIMRDHDRPLAHHAAARGAGIGAWRLRWTDRLLRMGLLASRPDGRPEPLFNRTTGDIDPRVAAYWRSHFDIVEFLNSNWKAIGSDLRGKIHLVVAPTIPFILTARRTALSPR